MSSDLLAEFDSFYRAPQSTSSKSAPASNDLSLLNNTKGDGQAGQELGFPQWASTPKTDSPVRGNTNTFQPAMNIPPAVPQQGDIWGSLDVLSQGSRPPSQISGASTPNYNGYMPKNLVADAPQNKPEILRIPTDDFFTGQAGRPPPAQSPVAGRLAQKPPTFTNAPHGDILFDAEEQSAELDDEDEFGDFETVASPSLQAPSEPYNAAFSTGSVQSGSAQIQNDLLWTDASQNQSAAAHPRAAGSTASLGKGQFAGLGPRTNQISKINVESNPEPSWSAFESSIPHPSPRKSPLSAANTPDDDWATFSDHPPETPAAKTAKPSSDFAADAWDWGDVDTPAQAVPTEVSVAPPTNIPPPSILLALFPSLFDLPQSTLFRSVSIQTFSLRNRILSDPSTIDFLRAYLLIATVAARVIAGRKLRWKRDTLLSQAMKIGPAAAGGKGGMKLTGVDKAETTRENREASEVVRTWKDQLGRLRSAIAVTNSSIQDSTKHLVIPDISEVIQVKTQQGGLTAPKPCIICGLKREERANKVDIDVEDSFGEWWVEHWGHRSCRNFWLEHESTLKGR